MSRTRPDPNRWRPYEPSNVFLYIGNPIGKNVKFKEGKKTTVNSGARIVGKVTIGEGCQIGINAVITAEEHTTEKNVDEVVQHSVSIGDNVLIGANVVILHGTIIEDGAIIGAGSVVTAYSFIGKDEIWAGNPAKRLRKRQ